MQKDRAFYVDIGRADVFDRERSSYLRERRADRFYPKPRLILCPKKGRKVRERGRKSEKFGGLHDKESLDAEPEKVASASRVRGPPAIRSMSLRGIKEQLARELTVKL